VNNFVTFVPVAARPRTGISAAPLGASDLSGFALTQGADFRAMAPSCAATGVLLLEQPLQAAIPAMPGLSQQGTTVETYRHAIGAAAKRDSQTGSLPAWDPV
jgi:hypothetical protein